MQQRAGNKGSQSRAKAKRKPAQLDPDSDSDDVITLGGPPNTAGKRTWGKRKDKQPSHASQTPIEAVKRKPSTNKKRTVTSSKASRKQSGSEATRLTKTQRSKKSALSPSVSLTKSTSAKRATARRSKLPSPKGHGQSKRKPISIDSDDSEVYSGEEHTPRKATKSSQSTNSRPSPHSAFQRKSKSKTSSIATASPFDFDFGDG
eukprot:TRINITY_DN8858_c0_g2_i7.p1 TRINITY_DN8858_c0_g2~~TRINITY_DN8858_c0_g2_i7.p1  ORF type:complete len:204 (+),score=34.57 TRINITY_DN8858_c0_g2_i7:526-1137(+)